MPSGEAVVRGCAYVAAICVAGLISAFPTRLQAQTADASGYPNRPLRIVVGFAPGGGNDIASRIIGQKLGERLGQPVMVENKPGAAGFIAAELVARAPPDGYTLFSATTGTMIIAPSVYSKLPFDPLKSFTPVGITADYPLLLVVDASRGVKSLAELVAYTKANPAKSNYGSSSPLFQLPTELLKMKTGAMGEHIPFKGSQEVTGALLNGQLLMAFIDPGPVVSHIRSGKLRLIASTGSGRFSEMPEAPTFKELGTDVVVDSFMGLVAPAGTAPAAIKRLETELAAIRKLPDVIERMRAAGMRSAGGPAKEMGDTIAREIPIWSGVAKAANIKLD